MGWLTFDEPLDTEKRLMQVSTKSDKEAKLPPLPPVRPAPKTEPKAEAGEEKTSWFSKSSKQKPTQVKLPEHVPYLLIGGGTASYYAALTIRARDENARVIIIGEEHETPYSRPPLSKGWFSYFFLKLPQRGF